MHHLVATIFAPIICALFLRMLLLRDKSNIYPKKVLRYDFGLWIFIGVAIGGLSFFLHTFPLDSGLKIIFGSLCLGSFIAPINSLISEKQLIVAGKSSLTLFVNDENYFPITKKFAIFAAVSFIEFFLITLMVVYKDMAYIEHESLTHGHVHRAVISSLLEVSFVLAVILAGSLSVFFLYATNLKEIFKQVLHTLSEVARGNLSETVPVLSTDEFSSIAQSTNKMISGLRDKERIRSIFGKYMSPEVANRVLANKQDSELGGSSQNLAVLFSDIRSFTTISEKLPAEEVVTLLNIYFTEFVNVIHKHQGVLDKFIGDAVMGVFGLSESPSLHPAEMAVMAALEFTEKLDEVNQKLQARGLPPVSNGIGIHFGPVVVGNIGSPERLEYTVIGDTVNTASRLESSTKGLKTQIVISQDVFEKLSEFTQKRFSKQGEKALKGKNESTTIYKMVS